MDTGVVVGRRSVVLDLDFWVVTCIQMHCININVECRFELCLKLCSDYLSLCAHSLCDFAYKTVHYKSRCDGKASAASTGMVWSCRSVALCVADLVTSNLKYQFSYWQYRVGISYERTPHIRPRTSFLWIRVGTLSGDGSLLWYFFLRICFATK